MKSSAMANICLVKPVNWVDWEKCSKKEVYDTIKTVYRNKQTIIFGVQRKHEMESQTDWTSKKLQ